MFSLFFLWGCVPGDIARWYLARTQPLVHSVYCFLSCTFYFVTKKKKTQNCGVLVLAKRIVPPIEQIITDPVGRCVFFKIKNKADAVLALYTPSATMKERRTDRQMFIRKIEKLLCKKITRKNNLILG